MDPISIGGAVITVLGVLRTVYDYAEKVKHYSEDMQKLLTETKGLEAQLEELNARLKDANEQDPWFRGLLRLAKPRGDGSYEPDGIFAQLKTSCEELAGNLKPPEHHYQKYWAMAIWPLTKVKLKELLEEIDGTSRTIGSILQYDQFRISQANQEGIQEIRADMRTEKDEKEWKEIVQWLSPLEFRKRQHEIFDPELVTGRWLLKEEEFDYWINGRPWSLCCYGDPGAGKVCCPEENTLDHVPSDWR